MRSTFFRIFSLFSLLLMLFSPFPAQLTAQWRIWSDPANVMEIRFPAVYTVAQTTVRSALGTLEFQHASAPAVKELDFHAYVARVEAPVSAKMESARQRAEETIKNLGGKLISLDMIPVDDGWGVQFMAALNGTKRIKGRVYLFDGFLTELWVIADIAKISKAEGNQFLDSFRWRSSSREKLKKMLSATGLQFSADEDSDFKIAYRFAEEKRSQVAFITTFSSPAHENKVIEIWSPVYQSKSALPVDLANDLLSENSRISMGSFQTLTFDDGRMLAVFSVIVEMNISSEKLKAAIIHTLINADDKEAQLDSRDVY